jgi:hypothetical protein
LTAIERIRVKQIRVMQTDILGLSGSALSEAVTVGDTARPTRSPIVATHPRSPADFLSRSLLNDFRGHSFRVFGRAMTARVPGSVGGCGAIAIAMHRTQTFTLAMVARDREIGHQSANLAANVRRLDCAATGAGSGGKLGPSSCAISADGTNTLLKPHAPVIFRTGRTGEQVLIFVFLGTTGECWKTSDVLARAAGSRMLPIGLAYLAATLCLYTLWVALRLGIAVGQDPAGRATSAHLVRVRCGRYGIEAQ